MFRFVLNVFLIFVLGLIQLSGAIFIFGLKPNLVLSFAITASAFSRNWYERIILALAGGLAIKFHPGFDWNNIVFIISAFTGIALVHFFKWQTIISVLFAVIIATILINLYTPDLSLITQILINSVAAGLMYAALKMIYAKK